MTAAPRIPTEVPAAIAPLAVLPVFLTLAGRRVVVIGGTSAAAWKAELVAAAGAIVAVIAETLSPEMAATIARSSGAITHAATSANADTLAKTALAVIDAESDAEAEALSSLCRTARIPHNVIDRPAFGDFQFGTIVNRSPVVIGISTAGAAPILGQAIRQRIEAILPAALSAWARLAARLRDRVMKTLSPGPERRRFWQTLADRAFASAPPRPREIEGWIEAARQDTSARGRVTLVGAGPGDPRHLTLAAVRALQSADVILFDDLVLPETLELARREARRIAVGKRGGRGSCRQEDVNTLLVSLAAAGKYVVRLKSGDPAIFGRAGEEIAALEAAGISAEIVPGITAATALAARLGISLTHRDHARSLRLVTGHSQDGGLPADLDWRALADPKTTLAVYMAGATAPAFARRLIAHGLNPATPAVVAEAIARPGETIAALTLRDLARGHHASGDGPILVGIGAVFTTTRSFASQEPASPEAAAPAAFTPIPAL